MIRTIIKEILYFFRGEITLRTLKKRGLIVGDNFNCMGGVILDPSHCWLIKLGNNVTLAPHVHTLAHDASTKIFLGYTRIGCVNIGNNVFIGAESVVLPNVNIGDNVVVGSNSTVTKDLAPNAVYAGSPAKFVCTIEEFCNRNKNKLDEYPVFSVEYTFGKSLTEAMKTEMRERLRDRDGFVF